jgi:cell pole-organizing protein PopZ
MTQPAKSQEPSMEEILASIRRIIADDDATKSAQPAEPARAPAPPPPQAAPAPPPPAPRPPAAALRVAPPEPSLPEMDAASADAGAAPSGEASDHAADILDLTESMAAPSPMAAPLPPAAPSPMPDAAPQFRTIDGSFDVSYEEAAEKPAPQHPSGGGERAQLMSRETTAAVDSAFNTLAQTVLVQNARTLEDLVREMLRPMLKSWLDDNLPGMVERLVRAEIERVSRGRMG